MVIATGKIQTVLGPVDPSELGHVQPPERLFVNLVPPILRDLKGEAIRMEDLGFLRRNSVSNAENLIPGPRCWNPLPSPGFPLSGSMNLPPRVAMRSQRT